MSISSEDCARHINEQNSAELERIKRKVIEAHSEAKKIAHELRLHDPSIRAVYLFGSLAEGRPNRENFDIDIAIDGGDVFLAMDVTESSSFSVDVVSLSRLPEHVRQRILSRGVLL